MKYLKKERVEIQEVYLIYISFLEKNLNSTDNFLCHMDLNICKRNSHNILIKCGLNDRIIPNAITYLKSEMPTKVKNKVIYNLPFFLKNQALTPGWAWWDYCYENDDAETVNIVNTAINMEKIVFLQHLIKKLSIN